MYSGFVMQAPDLIEQEQRLTRERLLASKRALMAEIRRVDQLLGVLDASQRTRKSHDYAPPNGTLWTLRRYVSQLVLGKEVGAGEATAWMLAHGWQTTSKTPAATVSSAMKHAADRGCEGLQWVGTGRYRRIEIVPGT